MKKIILLLCVLIAGCNLEKKEDENNEKENVDPVYSVEQVSLSFEVEEMQIPFAFMYNEVDDRFLFYKANVDLLNGQIHYTGFKSELDSSGNYKYYDCEMSDEITAVHVSDLIYEVDRNSIGKYTLQKAGGMVCANLMSSWYYSPFIIKGQGQELSLRQNDSCSNIPEYYSFMYEQRFNEFAKYIQALAAQSFAKGDYSCVLQSN